MFGINYKYCVSLVLIASLQHNNRLELKINKNIVPTVLPPPPPPPSNRLCFAQQRLTSILFWSVADGGGAC